MYWTHLSKKRVVIRKPRRCDGCGASFPVGAGLWRTTGIWTGEPAPLTSYTCDVCEEWINRQDFDAGDELPCEWYQSVDPEGWAEAQQAVIAEAMEEAFDGPDEQGAVGEVPGDAAVGDAAKGQ